jgi:hypothetical protein
MKLTINNVVDPGPVSVEGDAYVPLTVRWSTPLSGQPVHFRIDGDAGGHLDLHIDLLTHRLLSLVVIDLPPVSDRSYQLEVKSQRLGDPVVDLTPWTSAQGDRITSRVVKATEHLVRWLETDAVYVAVAGDRAVRVVSAEDVDLLTATDGAFVGLALRGAQVKQWREAFAWL